MPDYGRTEKLMEGDVKPTGGDINGERQNFSEGDLPKLWLVEGNPPVLPLG